MFRDLIPLIGPHISGTNVLDLVRHIHDLDRWSSWDKYRACARYCHDWMAERGLAAELVPIPFDGRTRFGDWVMPYAWDCTEATLSVLDASGAAEELCRYTEEPCCVAVYSMPTPPGGVTAEIVVMEGGSKPEHYEGVDVSGKVILTRETPRMVKLEAARHGAVGVICDGLPWGARRPPLSLSRSRVWELLDADHRHGGWGIKEGDTLIWGFLLTPEEGYALRERLRRDSATRVHARIESRVYEGSLDIVTALIPGETDEEVLINGHLHEVGAMDNASGCAVAMDVLHALSGLIERGALPRPRRGIRMLFTFECMGTMAAALGPRGMISSRRTVAGITLDCVGGQEHLTGAPLSLYHNPHAQTSYTDGLLGSILSECARRSGLVFSTDEKPYMCGDNLVSDPSIGVPCPMLVEYPYLDYHLSTDTPEKLSPEKLGVIGQAVATYVWFVANAQAPEAKWLAASAFGDGCEAGLSGMKRHVADHAADVPEATAQRLRETIEYARTRYSVGISSVRRLAEDDAELGGHCAELERRLNDFLEACFAQGMKASGGSVRRPRARRGAKDPAASRVYKRLVPGPFAMARVPAELHEAWQDMYSRNGINADAVFSALCWCDGRRSIGELETLVAGETGLGEVRLSELFEGLERHGYVRLVELGA